MKIEDVSLAAMNREVRSSIAERDLDFFAALAWDCSKNLSVVGRFCPWEDGYVKLVQQNGALTTAPAGVEDELYYGVSPRIDNDVILRCISEWKLTTPEALDRFLAAHGDLFMMHSGQSRWLADFARYAVVCFAQVFGLRLQIPEGQMPELDDLAKRGDGAVRRKDDIVTICGCPTEEMLAILSRLRYQKTEADEHIWAPAPTGLTIREVYAIRENIRLIDGSVFYSGTLIRPHRLECGNGQYENFRTQTVTIFFERTTYATVYALDRDLTRHPLLAGCRENLQAMLRQDDAQKAVLIEALDSLMDSGDDRAFTTERALEAMNAYLKSCINVNQLGVSANVITADGLLLMGERSASSIDGGSLYPGVNGNAEIADRNVSFYQYAVQEDFPTVEASEYSVRFSGEIRREAAEELGLEVDSTEFECSMLMISGNRPKEGARHRRLHFNILFEYHSKLTFDELEDRGRRANEAFENRGFVGYDIRTYANRCSWLRKGFSDAVEWVTQAHDFWESLLLLVMILPALLLGTLGEYDVVDYISLTLAVFIVLSTLRSAWSWGKELRHHADVFRRLTLLSSESYEQMNQKLRKRVNGFRCHPVARGALQYHAEKRMLETMKPKDRRTEK